MSIKRKMRRDEIPNDLQISKKVYLEVGTDEAIKECIRSKTFAVCIGDERVNTIYIIDKSVAFKNTMYHELKHVEQHERKQGNIWDKGKVEKFELGYGGYWMRASQWEIEAVKYTLGYSSPKVILEESRKGHALYRSIRELKIKNDLLKSLSKK